jgi:hypothetical protein
MRVQMRDMTPATTQPKLLALRNPFAMLWDTETPSGVVEQLLIGVGEGKA